MPAPAALTVGAELLPFILSIFGGGGGREERRPEDVLAAILPLMRGQIDPMVLSLIASASRAGAETGAQVESEFRGRVGRAGGGSTGVGRTVRGLASSAASSRSVEGSGQAQQFGQQLLMSALGGMMNLQEPGRRAGFLENFRTMIAQGMVTGGNPFRNLLNAAYGGGGASGGGGGGGSDTSYDRYFRGQGSM